MPVKFSEAFKINPLMFKKNSESLMQYLMSIHVSSFDPARISLASAPEFIGARGKVERYCTNIIALLSHSKNEDDMYWKQADKMLKFQELSGTLFWLLPKKGTGGNAIGRVLRRNILETIVDLIREGATDPTLFELLEVFRKTLDAIVLVI